MEISLEAGRLIHRNLPGNLITCNGGHRVRYEIRLSFIVADCSSGPCRLEGRIVSWIRCLACRRDMLESDAGLLIVWRQR